MTRTTLVAIALASGLVGAWALGNQRPLIAVALLALTDMERLGMIDVYQGYVTITSIGERVRNKI